MLFMTTTNSNADVALNFYWVVLKEPDLNPVPEKWIKAFHFFIFFYSPKKLSFFYVYHSVFKTSSFFCITSFRIHMGSLPGILQTKGPWDIHHGFNLPLKRANSIKVA